jgi:N-acetylglucosamine-6-sulfatase
MRRITRLGLIAAVFAMAVGPTCKADRTSDCGPPAEADRVPPNLIVVVVDDLRWDEFGAAGHPYLETPNIDRLAQEGAIFRNAFHVVPLCSPNRASILTGQYPSRHGIIDNVARNLLSHSLRTFPRVLQQIGYETAFIGKWHMGNDPTPRPGFDYWVALPGQGRTLNPRLYEEGQLRAVEGYVTELLTDRALAFIRRSRETPFLLYLSHKALHPDSRQLDDGSVDRSRPAGHIPAPRYRGRYRNAIFTRRPNVAPSREQLDEKPALRKALAFRNSDLIMGRFEALIDPGTSEKTIRGRAEMLLSVDESLGRILETLEELQVLNETMILFTSDNGYFYGEHGLSIERRLPYEEAIRNVLLVRYPHLAAAGSEIDGLALSIDIAPTALEVAGSPIGSQVQGRSLIPLLVGTASNWRRSALIEFFTHENPMPWLMDMDYRAVRTDRYKYIHWMRHDGADELYDLETDPYELQNLIDEPRMAGVRKQLRAELETLVLEAMGL